MRRQERAQGACQADRCGRSARRRGGAGAWREEGQRGAPGLARPKGSEFAQQKAGGKPILYDFTAAWCAPCHRLDAEGLSDPEIASLINSAFVLSRVVDRKREDGRNPPAIDELEGRYSVRAFPTLVVATQDGRRIARLNGYPGRKGLLRFLQESSRKTP